MTIFDLTAEIAGVNYYYRKGMNKYLYRRNFERQEVAERFRYLKRMGYIDTFIEKNDRFMFDSFKYGNHCTRVCTEHHRSEKDADPPRETKKKMGNYGNYDQTDDEE